MSAVVRVGMQPEGLELEVFQPMCLDHDPVWLGTVTFDLATAKTNARVHDTDRHRATRDDVCPWHPDSPETHDRQETTP